MPPNASRQALEALLLKYTEILTMRAAGIVAQEGEPGIQARMAELASRFPGALRELDDLELDEIRRRIEALEAAIGDASRVERWMEAMTLFHSLARGALCAKRWLSGRRHVDADLERDYAASVHALRFPDDARAWSGQLDRIASPPRGRVSLAVLARVGHHFGTTERAANHLVFGALRRSSTEPEEG
jgi:hypothetical protein